MGRTGTIAFARQGADILIAYLSENRRREGSRHANRKGGTQSPGSANAVRQPVNAAQRRFSAIMLKDRHRGRTRGHREAEAEDARWEKKRAWLQAFEARARLTSPTINKVTAWQKKNARAS